MNRSGGFLGRARAAFVTVMALLAAGVVGVAPAAADHNLTEEFILPPSSFCGIGIDFLTCLAISDLDGGNSLDSFDDNFPQPAGAACEGVPPSGFTDRVDDRSWREIVIVDCLAALPSVDDPLLKGTNGMANLDALISRAQYVVTLVRQAAALKQANGTPLFPGAQPDRWLYPANPTFPDVPKNHVFYRQIETAVSLGLFKGTNLQDFEDVDQDGDKTETLFLPNANITYAQIVKSDDNLLKQMGSSGDFAGGSTSLDCRAFAENLVNMEWIGIVGQGSLLPDDCLDPATRGQSLDALTGITTSAVADGLMENPYGPTDNTWFEVLTADSVTVTDDDVAPDELTDQREYKVTDPFPGTGHTIVLFRADRMSITPTKVTFLDGSGQPSTADTADPGSVLSRIVSVNGATITSSAKTNAKPKDGALRFVVDGNGSESVIPVVFFAPDNAGTLKLFGDGEPIEPFGFGGKLDVKPGSLTVTPTTLASLTDDDSSPGTSDQREYTVLGTEDGVDHTIVLFDADRIWADDKGVYFLNAMGGRELGGTASPGTVLSSIVELNGVSSPLGQKATAKPVGGKILFTVDAEPMESIIPVVFVDLDKDGKIDLDSTGHPIASEPFALGGRIDGLAPKAPTFAYYAGGEKVMDVALIGVLSGATVKVHIGSDIGDEGFAGVPAYDAGTFQTQTFTMGTYGPYSESLLVARLTGLTPDTPYQLYFTQTVNGVTSTMSNAEAHTRPEGLPAVSYAYAYEPTDPSPAQTTQMVVGFTEPVTVQKASGLAFTSGSVVRRAVSAKKNDLVGTEFIFTLDGTVPFGDDFTSRRLVDAGTVKDLDGKANVGYPPL